MLLWYKDGVMIDGSYVVGKNGTVLNELTIYKLSPKDLLDKYVCQAANFNSTSPIEAYVSIDINRECTASGPLIRVSPSLYIVRSSTCGCADSNKQRAADRRSQTGRSM